MEKINQLFFVVFALFLLGIYLSTVKTSPSTPSRFFTWYWPASILTRAGAFLVWAAVPILGNSVLVFANVLYMASLVFLLFTFCAWTGDVSARLKTIACLFIITYAIIFELIKATFVARLELFIFSLAIIQLIELMVLLKHARQDKTFLLKLIIVLVCLQLAMTALTFNLIFQSLNSHVTNVLENTEAGSIGVWLTFSLHLIIYVVINSFLYQKLWESERKTHEELKQSRVALSDVTKEKKEIKRLLMEREDLVSRLLKANKTVSTGALSASIAHELNQPLTVIQMNIQLLDAITKGGQKIIDKKMQSDLIAEILDNNRRASKVVKSLKEIFSQSPKDFERVDLVHIIESVIEISRGELQHQNIKLDLILPNEAYANVFPQELLQVVLNLLNNAINALSQSIQSNKMIRVVLAHENARISIVVEDNGPGITPEMQGQLFELLADTKGTGMGLGLWLCQYVLNHHEGKIWHEPVQTGGARFCLDFADNLVSYKILS
jgi:signal transduction histidine kinase